MFDTDKKLDSKTKAKMNVLRDLLNYGDDDLREKLKPKATVIEIGIGKPEMGKGMEEEKSEMIDEDSDDFESSSELSEEEKQAIEKIRKKYLTEKK